MHTCTTAGSSPINDSLYFSQRLGGSIPAAAPEFDAQYRQRSGTTETWVSPRPSSIPGFSTHTHTQPELDPRAQQRLHYPPPRFSSASAHPPPRAGETGGEGVEPFGHRRPPAPSACSRTASACSRTLGRRGRRARFGGRRRMRVNCASGLTLSRHHTSSEPAMARRVPAVGWGVGSAPMPARRRGPPPARLCGWRPWLPPPWARAARAGGLATAADASSV
jgi:hypothetical protein